MNKKGQAAMEFLMTYGWAILVVIAAIAALAYFGVLDPARLLPERCQSSAGMDCVDKAVLVGGASGYIEVALRNNIGFPINVTDVSASTGYATCTNEVAEGGAAYSTVDGTDPNAVEIGNNEVLRVKMSACTTSPDSGDKFDGVLTVSYTNTETNLDHQVQVDIRGKVA